MRDPISTHTMARKTADKLFSKLKTKQMELHKGLPAHVACNQISEDIGDANPRIAYLRLLLRLDHLLNLFLVERLLLKHGHGRGDILRTSFEMVVLNMQFWTNKHRWGEIQGESQWLVSQPHSLPDMCFLGDSETGFKYLY
jgi:hypothetical protein